AEQNGERLRLAPGKAIQVELVSEVPVAAFGELPQYAVYQLDSAAHRWVYHRIDLAEWLDAPAAGLPADHPYYALNELEERYERDLESLTADNPLPTAPVPPTRASGNRPTIELNFLTEDLALAPDSDLSAEDLQRLHQNAIWEILPESGEVDERAFNVTWEQVRLRALTGQRYELTLMHALNEETLIVRPVLLGDDYNRALAAYESEKAAYDSAIAEREALLAYQRENLRDEYQANRARLMAALQQLPEDGPQPRRKLVHRFVINAFGYWSCAIPHTLDTPMVPVNYTDEAGHTFEDQIAYMVPKGQNTLLRFVATPGAKLALTLNDPYLLWVVDEDARIAYTHSQEIQPSTATESYQDLVLVRGPNPMDTEADVRELLSF
ncbi:MAG: hypothetical protein KDC54_02400, partial [Lewinella sp.]|nr:hypothetical protein [Lewinella sp.]